jgi:hypothetical protein
MQPYVRTQHAAWMWWILLPVLAIVASAWFTSPGLATLLPLALVIVIIGAVGAVFTRLTIRVDADAVTWHFGWGWPSSAISMREIERAEVTQTNLLEGWGIHWTIWHGWLWNVGGFQAVEIFKRNGSGVTLGSDDPQGLFQAIERFRKGAA